MAGFDDDDEFALAAAIEDDCLDDNLLSQCVMRFAKSGGNINYRVEEDGRQGWSFLHIAAHASAEGHVSRNETMESLLDRRVDPSWQDSHGLSAAWYVNYFACARHSFILQRIVEGSDVNLKARRMFCRKTCDSEDTTKEWIEEVSVELSLLHLVLLHMAFLQLIDTSACIVELLLRMRSDSNARIKDPDSEWKLGASVHGFAPLHLAARATNPKVVALLLEAAADPNCSTIDFPSGCEIHPLLQVTSLTPLGVLSVPQLRLQSEEQWYVTVECSPPDAVYQGTVLRQLLDANADPTVLVTYEINKVDRSSLAHGFLGADALQVLLDHKRGSSLVNHRATILDSTCDFRNTTPLMASICRCNQAFRGSELGDQILRKVKILLEHGADVHASTPYGHTALHLLAATSFPCDISSRILEGLLSHKAFVDAPSLVGHTPLHVASACGKCFMIKALLENHANPACKNVRSQTPLHMSVSAHARQHFEGRTANKQLLETSIGKIQCLLKSSADPHSLDDKGRNLLHHVSDMDDRALQELVLLSITTRIHGIIGDKQIVDSIEDAQLKKRDLVSMDDLVGALGRFASNDELVNAKDWIELETPLHCALRHGRTNIARVLIACKAEINVSDAQGRTPLYWAGVHCLLGKGSSAKDFVLNAQADPSTELVPATLRRKYILGEELGRGCYGVVYKALPRQNGNGEVAALKVQICSDRFEPTLHWKELVENESTILESVSGHPNVANLKRWCFEGDVHLLLLDLIQGPLVFSKFATRPGDSHDPPLDEDEALRRLRDVLAGLVHLHRARIVHRDLKVENCVLSSTNAKSAVILVDFGLAREMPRDGSLIKRDTYGSSDVHGGDFAISPEKEYARYDANCKYGYGLPSDVWCIGNLAHVLLSGELPFPNAPTNFKPGRAKLLGHAAWTDVSARVKNLLTVTLQADPARRPTASELLQHVTGQRDHHDDVLVPSISSGKGGTIKKIITAIEELDSRGTGFVKMGVLRHLFYCLGGDASNLVADTSDDENIDYIEFITWLFTETRLSYTQWCMPGKNYESYQTDLI